MVRGPGKSHQDACSFSFLCLQYGSYRQNKISSLVSPIASSFSFLLPCTDLDLSYVSSCLGKQWQMLVSANKSTRSLELGMYCSPASSRSEPAMQNHKCWVYQLSISRQQLSLISPNRWHSPVLSFLLSISKSCSLTVLLESSTCQEVASRNNENASGKQDSNMTLCTEGASSCPST